MSELSPVFVHTYANENQNSMWGNLSSKCDVRTKEAPQEYRFSEVTKKSEILTFSDFSVCSFAWRVTGCEHLKLVSIKMTFSLIFFSKYKCIKYMLEDRFVWDDLFGLVVM